MDVGITPAFSTHPPNVRDCRNPFDFDAFQRGLYEIDESENSCLNWEEKRSD